MKTHFLNVNDTRRSNNPQLWIIGCSFAHGIGVKKDQRFGQLLANKLELPASFLTQGGTSISWAADQILRSDIRANDIVVWSLTGASRIPYLDESNNLNHVYSSNFEYIPDISNFINKNFLVSNHMLYESFTHISQVKNYLEKIGTQFVLAVMPLNGKEHDLQTINFTKTIKNSIILFDQNNYSFIDLGDDNLHPGPLHHQWYSDQIYLKFKELYK